MSWNGVKKQSYEQEVKSWCDAMGIKDYTINDKGEIDVDGSIWLDKKDLKELPYKFGIVNGYFDIGNNLNLISLKNCPNCVDRWFACDFCPQLDSLEGCPKEVEQSFYCGECKREFKKEEIESLCKVNGYIYN